MNYPIYAVSIRWTEDGESEKCPWWPTDPGPGRIWNSIGLTYRMYKDDKDIKDIEQELHTEWWIKYREKRPNASDLILTVKFSHRETWCPDWFQHWTFDEGQDDSELLASFASYIDRMMQYNRENGKMENDICLMSAEDMWRWEGPCRCEHCKKLGIVRIDH